MRSSRESTWKKVFYSRWFLAVLFVLCFLVLFAYARAYYADYQVEQEIKRLEAETKALQAKKLETLELLKQVQSTAFVEEQARQNLNLEKPGENMVIISRTNKTPRGQTAETVVQDEEPQRSNVAEWWRYFFGPKT
jgi:cell division protein FtsB